MGRHSPTGNACGLYTTKMNMSNPVKLGSSQHLNQRQTGSAERLLTWVNISIDPEFFFPSNYLTVQLTVYLTVFSLQNTIITQLMGVLVPERKHKEINLAYCDNPIFEALDKPKISVLILKRKAT